MNHKSAFVALAAAFTVLSASAAHLSPAEALSRAVGSVAPASTTAASGYNLVYSLGAEKAPAGEDALYVFDRKGDRGFIVVSADDLADPILGYSDNGSFDPAAIPPDMAWWLGEYARQIEAAASASTLTPMAVERPERTAIEPLVTTTWNQDAPYNALCPSYNGQRSVTGCVATAMAQVVNYHKWPQQGVGSHQYYYNGGWISLDFSKITFNWSQMLDSYASGAGNELQKLAVAQLMYACGVSVEMQYSPIESGAADVLVASALVDNFNYDLNVRYAERDYFGLLEWEEFIYNQLRDYGPVQYSGSSSAGGHSFVCDGYSADGYFHINWGWGGISDGYFRLTALDPPSQGIGGASSGYNYSQAVIANIRKPKTGSKMYLNLMMDQGFAVTPVKTTTKPGDQLKVSRRVINYSVGTATGSLGIKFVNNETEEVKYSSVNDHFNLPTLTPLTGYTVQIPAGLRNGTYTLTPVMCGTEGVWTPVPVKLSGVQKSIMTIKNGICTFAEAYEGTVTVSDVELLTPVYLGNLFRLKAKVANPGESEFVGQIVPTLASGRTPIAKSDPIPVDLLPGEETEINFTGIFNHFSSSALPPAGTYTLYMVKESTNEILSEGIEVELHDVPENTTVSVSGFAYDGDSKNADPAAIRFTGKLSCTEGFFGRSLNVVVFPYTSGQVTSVAFFSTDDIFIGEGQEVTFTAGGPFPAAEVGKRYFALVYDGQTLLTPQSDMVVFTIGKPSGIEEIEADGDSVVATRVYTPAGSLVMESNGAIDMASAPLRPAVYIVETVRNSGAREAIRVVKR